MNIVGNDRGCRYGKDTQRSNHNWTRVHTEFLPKMGGLIDWLSVANLVVQYVKMRQSGKRRKAQHKHSHAP